MKVTVDFTKIIYGELLEYLQKVESTPLLRMTLAEANKLSQLYKFIKNFIPEAFFAFVISSVFNKPYPVPEAPITSWKSRPRERHYLIGDYIVGWVYVSIHFLKKQGLATPKALLNTIKKEHRMVLKDVKKWGKKKLPNLCCIVLAPDWEWVKDIRVKLPRKTSKISSMPVKKFVAEFRRCAKAEGIEVLTFKGLLSKYEKTIMKSSFDKIWSDYRWKLYLDFVKYFPMLAYSLCHDDYLAYRDNKNRAELDLLDGKYPEAVAMNCKALEAVLRIYYFMKHMKEAPDKELGWLFQSMKNHITREMGEIYCKDLEFVLAHRPHAVHAKKKKKKVTELEAQEVNDRVSIFCKTFFYQKWRIRI